MKPIKVVFDTNIFISGLFWSGLPNRLWFLAKFGSFELLVSDPILKEIERSLTRKFSYNEVEASQVTRTIKSFSRIVYPKKVINRIKEDPSDNRILECAFEGGAKYIVSGDKHLLAVEKYKSISILTARDFLSFLQNHFS